MREGASVRTNILLTPTEHRAWTAKARSNGVSLAEFIRRSVVTAEAAPGAAEMAELAALAAELAAASDRMDAAVAAALAQLDASARPERDADMRARSAARLAAQPIDLDPALLDFAAL